MQVKNNPFKLDSVQWKKYLNDNDFKVANTVINKLRKNADVIQKTQRASEEIFNLIDETKDPYTDMIEANDKVIIDTDGTLEYMTQLRSGEVTSKPYRVSNYNYILINYYKNPQDTKPTFIDTIFKKYPVKLFVLSSLGRI